MKFAVVWVVWGIPLLCGCYRRAAIICNTPYRRRPLKVERVWPGCVRQESRRGALEFHPFVGFRCEMCVWRCLPQLWHAILSVFRIGWFRWFPSAFVVDRRAVGIEILTFVSKGRRVRRLVNVARPLKQSVFSIGSGGFRSGRCLIVRWEKFDFRRICQL